MEEENQSDYSKHFENMFRKADKNQDGLISYQELKTLMKDCGYPVSDAELQDLVNDVDINENDTDEEIQEVFKIFDKNHTKLITTKNVMDIFSKIDENIKEEEILQMFKECDLDNDGYLNYQEFKRMIRNK